MPRYTPSNWWECDVYEITDSGYAREYEIKLSVSDFKADADKWDRKHTRNKHCLLESADEQCPKHFYFVVPESLISVAEVPVWAGLIYVIDNHPGSLFGTVYSRFCLSTVKEAPVINAKKVSDKQINAVKETGYWRYRSMLLNSK
jgi:hypothetical protein